MFYARYGTCYPGSKFARACIVGSPGYSGGGGGGGDWWEGESISVGEEKGRRGGGHLDVHEGIRADVHASQLSDAHHRLLLGRLLHGLPLLLERFVIRVLPQPLQTPMQLWKGVCWLRRGEDNLGKGRGGGHWWM